MKTTREVANILGCSVRYVAVLVTKGKLKPIVKEKRFFLFDESEVLTFKSLRDERK